MRLIEIKEQTGDGDLLLTFRELTTCDGPRNTSGPRYSVLSHRWRDEEILFGDVTGPVEKMRCKKGYKKFEKFCRESLRNGLAYAWVDTCCIDKSSSVELSEAINSMWAIYQNSTKCYAYLDDVEDDFGPESTLRLREGEWFDRGWTLQELLAPPEVTFFSSGWYEIGTRRSRSAELSHHCQIPQDVLLSGWDERGYFKANDYGVGERISWAAHRRTTRPEDIAYSLMGLVGVNMPPLYGEGATRAFRRLQLEIIKNDNDQTLFAWSRYPYSNGDMLTGAPSAFDKDTAFHLIPCGLQEFVALPPNTKPDYTMTNSGLHIRMPLRRVPFCLGTFLALLPCKRKMHNEERVASIFLKEAHNVDHPSMNRIVFDTEMLRWLSPADIQDCPFEFRTIWITNTTDKYYENWYQKLLYTVAFPKEWESQDQRNRAEIITETVPSYTFRGELPVGSQGYGSFVSQLAQGKGFFQFIFGKVNGRIWYYPEPTSEFVPQQHHINIPWSFRRALFGSEWLDDSNCLHAFRCTRSTIEYPPDGMIKTYTDTEIRHYSTVGGACSVQIEVVVREESRKWNSLTISMRGVEGSND